MNKTPLIALVEDNAPDVFLVRTALEQEGFDFQLRVFSDGEEIFNYLSQVESAAAPLPDLLLLDLNLPKRGGLEILEGLRKAPDALPAVIVISSSDSPDDQTSAARLGVAHFFRKPADLDEFMKIGGVVREVLRQRDMSKLPTATSR